MASKFSLILINGFKDTYYFYKGAEFFYSAAEIFGHSGRKMLKWVGSTKTYLGGFFSLGSFCSLGGLGSRGLRGFRNISSSSSNVSA
jgi:hypothetical protein